jgi:acetyl esterase/lipase
VTRTPRPLHSILLTATLLALTAATARAADADAPDEKSSTVKIEEAVPYREVDGRKLELDIAYPADNSQKHPAILFIHGGGWRGGNRQIYRRAIEEAAGRGYVAATVTYRLTEPDKDGRAAHPFPAAVHDVKAAVRYLRENAERYGIDAERIGATGGSAGGHLSLMLGVTDEDDGLEGKTDADDPGTRVQAVVNVFGPTDMAHLHATSRGAAPIVATFLAGTPDNAADAYRQSSPITHVTKDDPPTLTIHGTADTLVPPDQAELFDQAMKKAGATHELLLLEGQGHGFRGEANTQANEAMYRFFDKHLKPQP